MLLALLIHASVSAFSFHSCCIQPSMLSALFSRDQQKAPLIPAELPAPNNHEAVKPYFRQLSERVNETTLQPTDASHIATEDVDFPKMSMFCCCRRRNVEKAPPAHVKCIGDAVEAKFFLATEYGPENICIQCFETMENAHEVAHQKGNPHILFEKDSETGEVREKATGGYSLRHEAVRDAVKPYFQELSKRANKRNLQLVCANRITLQQVNQAILQQDKSEKLTVETLGEGLTISSGHPWNLFVNLKVEKKMQLNADDIQSEVITTISLKTNKRFGEGITKILDRYEVDGKKLNIYTDVEILKPVKLPLFNTERVYKEHMDHQKKVFAAIGCT